MAKRPISSAKFSSSDDISSLERPLADIAESLNTSRMTLLTLQTHIERLNSQQTSLYTQFEKVDRLLSRLSELPSQVDKIDRLLSRLNEQPSQVDKIDRLLSRLNEQPAVLDRLLPHLNDLQAQYEKIDHALTTQSERVIPQVSERLESLMRTRAAADLKELSAVCVDAVESLKTVQGEALSQGLEDLKDVTVRQRATEAESLRQSVDLNVKELGSEIQTVVRQQTEGLRQSVDLNVKELGSEVQTVVRQQTEDLRQSVDLNVKELGSEVQTVVRQQTEDLRQSVDLNVKELGDEVQTVVRQQTEGLKQSIDLNAKELEAEIQIIKESLALFALEPHMQSLKETVGLQQDAIAHLVSEMKARVSSLEEEIAVKADVGEIMVKLEQMRIIEKENIALLSQHVSQVPNAHQLAQIYYAINKKASGRMVSFLWVASTAAILVFLLFQPQIHQILETYWMILLNISS